MKLVKLEDEVHELLGSIGKKEQTYSEVVNMLAQYYITKKGEKNVKKRSNA